MDDVTKIEKVDRPLPPLVPRPYTLAELAERAVASLARRGGGR